MYHRWVWPVVAIVTAIIIITIDGFIEQTVVRVCFLSGVFGIAITAFGCLVSCRYLPMLTSPQEGTHASPGEGPMYLSITVRGETAAMPQSKAEKEAFDVRMWEAYQFAAVVLTMTAHEPGSMPQLLAERELMLAKYRHIELENEQLRDKVERLLPNLTQAVKEAGLVLRAAKPVPAATSAPERRPKKQKTRQEKPVRAEMHEQTAAGDIPDGICDWCETPNSRLIRVYHVQRADKDEPEDMNVCRGRCQSSSILRGRGSLTPPDMESGDFQLQAEPETAVAS